MAPIPKPNFIKAPPKPWVPAGYLPAPKQARFISEAEQAAEKLPPTIKAQSLKNALLKGGAKPLELEYAGMDDFISQNQGKPVSAADVLAHLKTEGPLGKLKRVEQQVVDGQAFDGQAFGGITDDDPYSNPNYDESVQLLAPEYASDVRKPFDQQTASNQTGYHRYTVPGKKNDFTGYREILLEDPRNALHDQNRIVIPENGIDPVNAHAADYFARYNEYPDRIALQNIQSDMGQDYAKSAPQSPDEIEEMDADLDILNQRLEDLQARWNHATDADERHWISQELEELQEKGAQDYMLNYTPEGDAYFESKLQTPTSPIARDDNWKNLMARHIALQSINGGGKPITIPTGRQMVDVEGFGLGTHGDHQKASKSAEAYNTDIVRRLQKIFRGLHPDGASVTVPPRSSGPMVTSIDPSTANIQATAFKNDELRTLFEMPNEIANDGDYGPLALGNSRILSAIRSGDLGAIEKAVQVPARPEFRDRAMKVIQYNRLMQEMGNPGVSDAPNASQIDDTTPGWTIKPSPMAVRKALEKGLPIMSLAPLLLQPQGESK